MWYRATYGRFKRPLPAPARLYVISPFFGSGRWIRTTDMQIQSLPFYQLNYPGIIISKTNNIKQQLIFLYYIMPVLKSSTKKAGLFTVPLE